MVLAKAPCCGMSEVVAEGGEDASEKPPVMLALPMSETYTGALSHGPGGVLSWARARYTLAHRGRALAACVVEVVASAQGGVVSKRLRFDGSPLVLDVDELRPTARGSGTGHALWPGAIALSLWLHGERGALDPESVIELGCGAAALPGITAARTFPEARVSLTDGASDLLPVVRAAAARCGARGVAVRRHNYYDGGRAFDGLEASSSGADGDGAGPPEPADLVLGAEIAYRAEDADAIAAEVPARLRRGRPGAVAVLCSQRTRAPLRAAGEQLRSRGMDVTDDVITLAVSADDAEAGPAQEFRLLRARWPA